MHKNDLFPRKNLVLIFICMSLLFLTGNTGCGVDEDRKFIKMELEDYSQMGWVEAFDALHSLIKEQYAFTDWKSIDLNTLNSTIRPKIALAETASNQEDFATALLEYSRSFPDGHVHWGDEMIELINTNTKGSYGLGIIGLDDGKVIAHIVTPGGPAATTGAAGTRIDVGAEILEWDDVAITTAVSQASTLWRPNPASIATNEHKLYEQYRALTLGKVGATSKIKYKKSDGTGPFTVTLTTTDDNKAIKSQTKLWERVDDDDPITYKELPSGYGYIQLGTLESDDISTETLFNKFQEAMDYLTGRNVPGIIIDLRGNGGGSDDLAAKISGFFYSETTFYEYQNIYNAYNGKREILLPSADDSYIIGWDIPLNITPQTPFFTGPVVAIVNPDSASSAEGVALMIKNLPNGYVVSFYGTNGSFGMTGEGAKLPLNYSIGFPTGQSLNENKEIQLDSKNGVGGVSPDVRVPKTSARMINYVNNVDVELDYAVSYLQSL